MVVVVVLVVVEVMLVVVLVVVEVVVVGHGRQGALVATPVGVTANCAHYLCGDWVCVVLIVCVVVEML